MPLLQMSEPNRQYHQALSANRKLLEENARLKAEVERLRMAAQDIIENVCQTAEDYKAAMQVLNAAKGVQS